MQNVLNNLKLDHLSFYTCGSELKLNLRKHYYHGCQNLHVLTFCLRNEVSYILSKNLISLVHYTCYTSCSRPLLSQTKRENDRKITNRTKDSLFLTKYPLKISAIVYFFRNLRSSLTLAFTQSNRYLCW